MLAYKQIHFLIGKPSKDPRHPDYAPSIFSFKEQDASPAVSNLARLSRAESRRKRHRDEVESNRLAKTPRMETIEIENDGPTGSNSTDPYTSDILTVQSECNQLQPKICQLEEQNQQLQSDKNMLERTLSGVRMELAATQAANATLSQENAHLENQLRCAKFGAENIRDDDAKTCFYTSLPTFTLFITLFNLLKGYAPGVPESKGINNFFCCAHKTSA